MHRGYTKRWRKRWDKKYHRDPYLFILMEYFIDFANHKDSEIYFPNVGVIPLKRGQHIFGTQQLAEFIGIGRQRIRSKLKLLEKLNFLTIKSTNKYSIATVINYDIYNPQAEADNQQNKKRATSTQPALNQHLTTPNNVNNVNKGNNIKKKKFTAPSFQDVILYFKENGYSEEAAKNAFLYYDEADPPWTDSTGKKVRSWKQKMRGVWFKPENKKIESEGIKNRKITKAGDMDIYDN